MRISQLVISSLFLATALFSSLVDGQELQRIDNEPNESTAEGASQSHGLRGVVTVHAYNDDEPNVPIVAKIERLIDEMKISPLEDPLKRNQSVRNAEAESKASWFSSGSLEREQFTFGSITQSSEATCSIFASAEEAGPENPVAKAGVKCGTATSMDYKVAQIADERKSYTLIATITIFVNSESTEGLVDGLVLETGFVVGGQASTALVEVRYNKLLDEFVLTGKLPKTFDDKTVEETVILKNDDFEEGRELRFEASYPVRTFNKFHVYTDCGQQHRLSRGVLAAKLVGEVPGKPDFSEGTSDLELRAHIEFELVDSDVDN